MVIACAQGGTSIEDLAEEDPDQIIKVPIDVKAGMTDANAAEIVKGLQVSGDAEAAKDQVRISNAWPCKSTLLGSDKFHAG